MIGLTPRLALTASAIGELTEALGRPPTQAELAQELDISIAGLALQIDKLTRRGWLAALPSNRHRRQLVLLHPAPPPPDDCAFVLTGAGRALASSGAPTHG